MKIHRIDAHSHVAFEAYKDDMDTVIRRSIGDGTGMLVVGTRKSTSNLAVACAEKYEGVWAIIGLHPGHTANKPYHDSAEIPDDAGSELLFEEDYYLQLARKSAKVVGIGECGLDYYRMDKNADNVAEKAVQLAAFRAQLDLAHELQMPVMIHCRDAHDDLATTLEEYRDAGKSIRGNIHCFTGTKTEAERYLELGFYLSFTGIVTFPTRAADKVKNEPSLADIANAVPLDRLLIETDAPYLAPVPHRGERNEPAHVKYIAEFLAVRRGISTEEMERHTLENTKTLFGLRI